MFGEKLSGTVGHFKHPAMCIMGNIQFKNMLLLSNRNQLRTIYQSHISISLFLTAHFPSTCVCVYISTLTLVSHCISFSFLSLASALCFSSSLCLASVAASMSFSFRFTVTSFHKLTARQRNNRGLHQIISQRYPSRKKHHFSRSPEEPPQK